MIPTACSQHNAFEVINLNQTHEGSTYNHDANQHTGSGTRTPSPCNMTGAGRITRLTVVGREIKTSGVPGDVSGGSTMQAPCLLTCTHLKPRRHSHKRQGGRRRNINWRFSFNAFVCRLLCRAPIYPSTQQFLYQCFKQSSLTSYSLTTNTV